MKKLTKQEIKELKNSEPIKVVLGKKFGMPPTLWVPLLYALVLLILLLLYCYIQLVPKAGQYYHIDSVPKGAAVYVDKQYIGTSPIRTLLKPGTHIISMQLPYYTSSSKNISARPTLLFRKLGARPITATLLPEHVDEEHALILNQDSYASAINNMPSEQVPQNAIPQEQVLQKAAYYWPMDYSTRNIIANTISRLAAWNITNVQTSRYIIPPVLEESFSQLYEVLAYISSPSKKDNAKSQASKNEPEKEADKSALQAEAHRTAEIDNIIHIIIAILYHSRAYINTRVDANIETTSIDGNASPRSQQDAPAKAQLNFWLAQYSKLQSHKVFAKFASLYQHEEAPYGRQLAALAQFYAEHTTAQKPQHWTLPTYSTKPTATRLVETQRLLGIDFSRIANQKVHYTLKAHSSASPLDPIQSYMEIITNKALSTEALADYKRSNSVLETEVPEFYIMNTEVSQAQFAAFLDDINLSIKEWKAVSAIYISPDHKTKHFLDYKPAVHPTRPLRYITWYDAKAYSNWFASKVRQHGLYATLPNEYQWQAAVQSYPKEGAFNMGSDFVLEASNTQNPSLLGNLWEWGSSWYSPNPQYSSGQGPSIGSEKHIFGGSYISNTQDLVADIPVHRSRNTALMPNWANAYVGFRLVLISLEFSAEN